MLMRKELLTAQLSETVFIIYKFDGPKFFDLDLFLKINGCSNA